jgi:ParB-like chromosome segregation protein Spo0J
MAKEKKPAGVPKNWANRIVGYTEESPDQLLANPQNWRVHSKNQQIALSGVLDDIGFIAPVIVNKNTGHLVDGHLRVSLALRHEIPTIPVVYVDITEHEEREALSTFDPITNMASSDMQMLEGLIRDLDAVNDSTRLLLGQVVHEANKKAVKDILDPMNGYMGTEESPDQLPKEAAPTAMPRSASNMDMMEDEEPQVDPLSVLFGDSIAQTEERDDFGKKVYPSMYSDNEWGVPTLNLMYQLQRVPVLIERWGRIARHNTRMPGLWHFYTDDYKFTGVWKNPDVVVNTGAIAAIEPNFSTGTNFAKAEVLYNIWQKRWLASYWQSRGIEIVVDLNIEDKFRDIALIGVPKGWRSYAIRLHELDGYDLDNVLEWETIAKEHAGTDDILFMIFATKTKGVEELCKERGWINCKMDAQVKGSVL